jgi:hypothetical protein
VLCIEKRNLGWRMPSSQHFSGQLWKRFWESMTAYHFFSKSLAFGYTFGSQGYLTFTPTFSFKQSEGSYDLNSVKNTKTSMICPIWKAKSSIPKSHMNNYTRGKLKTLPLLHNANAATSKFNCSCISMLLSVVPVMLMTTTSKCYWAVHYPLWMSSMVPAPHSHSQQSALGN